PDTRFKDGHPGECALNSIVSAALFLKNKPFVDRQHLGIMGHSFGGFETNYIVSKSNMFAAAVSASGCSDLISEYSSHNMWYYEKGQGRIGATLWRRPDLYMENSPVLRADKVNTPVLIMHTNNDIDVPLSQGLEWYHSLARLRKKVWMLTYAGENHSL